MRFLLFLATLTSNANTSPKVGYLTGAGDDITGSHGSPFPGAISVTVTLGSQVISCLLMLKGTIWDNLRLIWVLEIRAT